jgi:hypothetical protein
MNRIQKLQKKKALSCQSCLSCPNVFSWLRLAALCLSVFICGCRFLLHGRFSPITSRIKSTIKRSTMVTSSVSIHWLMRSWLNKV